MISICAHRFRLAVMIHFCILLHDPINCILLRLIEPSAKFTFHPVRQIILRRMNPAASPFLIIICEIHKETERILLKFQITDIDDPDIPHTKVICHRHLIPDFRQIRTVHPLIRDRRSVVIKVIIHAKAPAVGAHFLRRKCPHISIVILAEHQRHTV